MCHARDLELAAVHVHASQDVARGEETAVAHDQGLRQRHLTTAASTTDVRRERRSIAGGLQAHGAAMAEGGAAEADEGRDDRGVRQHLGGLARSVNHCSVQERLPQPPKPAWSTIDIFRAAI